jgi:hypothetical protein
MTLTVSCRAAHLAAGCTLGLSSLVVYAAGGYGTVMLVLWLAALALLAMAFARDAKRAPRPAVADLLAAAGLVVAFAPLYLARLHRWPEQVSSDEVSVMTNAKLYGGLDGVDPFGVSNYLGHPAALLVALGKIGDLLGGVDLLHMRILHGAIGLAVIAASYALFRQLLPRRWAVAAACVVGVSHSLLMLSRMALRENTSVLLEVAALALLLRGARHDQRLASFLGGVVAGAGFYVYYPARFTIVIWGVFLVALAVFGRSTVSVRRLGRGAIATVVGFVLVATPILVAEHNAPPEQVSLQRYALMIYPEARKLQRDWVFADSEWEGVRTNVEYGLLAFNNRVVDHSWLYVNEGHGFVDPVTGILLWIGVLLTLVALVRKRGDPWMLLALTGFALLWLTFALVVNKAPNYTRLLVTLPFVALLATVAIRSVAGLATRLAGRLALPRPRAAGAALAIVLLVVVAAANLSIARDFIDAGRERGDFIGSTGRWIESHPGTTFYLATEDIEPYRYYDWGYPQIWSERLRIFAGDPARVGEIVAPGALAELVAQPPFAVFMRRELWSEVSDRIGERFAGAHVSKVVPDGSRVVVEVPRTAG